MLLYVFQTPFVTPVQGTQVRKEHILGKNIFPSIEKLTPRKLQPRNAQTFNLKVQSVSATLIERPVLWIGRICIFYALLKIGLAGSKSNPFFPDSETEGDDLGFFKWFQGMKGESEEREANDRRKLVSKWHATTKGTLKRNYRVPSKAVGMRLLKSIASLLSDDDHFIDATSHKGCQIRRETAHGESVCCNNVRALFDELPTPHIVVEITAFPAGPLTDKDYVKAEKLEKVLRSGASI